MLRLDPRLAPVKVAVLPLSRNADLSPKAKDLAAELRQSWNVEFDDAGAIGRRYRRQDEIGTPFCVTVDFDTLDDQAVTVRERDTMAQERVGARPGRGLVGAAPRRLLTTRAPTKPAPEPSGVGAVAAPDLLGLVAAAGPVQRPGERARGIDAGRHEAGSVQLGDAARAAAARPRRAGRRRRA